MHTHSSSNLPVESSPNPSTSNPKRRNRRRSKKPFIIEESPVDTMADQRTMAELLRAPTECYAEAIVVPLIFAEQFKLKHSLINMMTSDQFFGLEKDNPHDQIRAARRWLEKEPSRSILTWEDLISKFIIEFFPPQERQIFCLAANGSTFSELRDNIQGYVAAAAVNYNQGNSGYRPPGVANQIRPPANPKGQLKAITNRSGIVLDGPYILIPPPFINLEEDERVEKTLTDQDFAEYTIKVPPLLVQKPNLLLKETLLCIKGIFFTPISLILQGCSSKSSKKKMKSKSINFAVILKKLLEKLGDPRKFLILCGFSELKCKALTDLANRAICTPAGIARVPLILGRPFLRTVHALIDVHGEEMILRDGDEKLTLNMRHDTSSYSNQPQKESINMINIFNDSSENFCENLFATNHQSGNPTFSPHPKLTSPKVKDDVFDPEGGNEFADELALITFSPGNDDLSFDIESDLKEIEYLLHHDPIKDMDSILEDSVDEGREIKESKLLIDKLDLPSDFFPSLKYDSFLSEDFSKVDALPSTNNEDKNVKKLAISHAYLILEDFDPPLYELPFFKEVLGAETLL
nr:hypothetical protein [Tanacetum cinerariifolium]